MIRAPRPRCSARPTTPSVAEDLAEQGAELELLSYTSKALPEPVAVRRWTVYREAM
jgi:hypothetical protein